MPLFWLFAVNPDGALSSAGCGLSNNSQSYPHDLSYFSAKIAIDDNSGNQQGFVTHTAPPPQGIQGWTVYLWTTPDYQADIIELRWSTQDMPKNIETRLCISRAGEWPLYADIGVNPWNAGHITLPAIKTDDWHRGMCIQVEMWNTATVPEPGGILALGTGLAGLVGFGRRRF